MLFFIIYLNILLNQRLNFLFLKESWKMYYGINLLCVTGGLTAIT